MGDNVIPLTSLATLEIQRHQPDSSAPVVRHEMAT
ncbi:hypothetical protein subunit 2 [Zymobacter palmae]|uniref:Uncharacterized protein n=1 Tax=Zymobacter palmae TaxID=33074 RepID=A0A348HEU4_9GAMM|nr:hypothetical protein subunit 2 [Zymobacter palmae]